MGKISPARPDPRRPGPGCTSQTQPEAKWLCSSRRHRTSRNSQEVTQTVPQSFVVQLCVLQHLQGVHHSEQAICPGTCAMQQDEPHNLQIWHEWNPLDEGLLFLERPLQLSSDVFSVAERSSQNIQALLVGWHFRTFPDFGLRICNLNDPFQHFTNVWFRPCSVPHAPTNSPGWTCRLHQLGLGSGSPRTRRPRRP